jgi:hypothetical protein
MDCACGCRLPELGAIFERNTKTYSHGISALTEEQQPKYDAAEACENRKITGSLGVIQPMGIPVLVDTLDCQERDIGV